MRSLGFLAWSIAGRLGGSLGRLLVPCLLAAPAAAGDRWVDPVNGADGNDGSSPALAWRTITHALATLGTSSDTVHLLPGSYTAAGGELFPLQAHGQSLVGEGMPELTVIDGEGTPQALLWTYFFVTDQALCPEVRGIRFTRAASGILVRGTWSTVALRVEDVVVDACGVGIDVEVGSSFGAASFDVTVQSGVVVGCTIGIGARSSFSAASTLTVEDSSILSCSGDGIALDCGSNGGGLTATLRRCRILGNGARGIHTGLADGGLDIVLEDSLVAGSGGEGYRAEAVLGSTRAHVRRSTIAHNGPTGIYSRQGGPFFHAVWLEESIVFGHAVEVDSNAVQSTAFSLVGVDPGFVDAAGGDYRLRFGGLAVDAGDPATPPVTLDLARRPRAVDGNLDTLERADVGCLEHAPLTVITAAHPGSPVRFEIAGPQGAAATLWFTRGPRVPPQSTPFGELELNPATSGPLFSGTAAPHPPLAFQRPIPNSPLVLGRTFSFQALVASPLAPSGFAWTNAEQFTVVP